MKDFINSYGLEEILTDEELEEHEYQERTGRCFYCHRVLLACVCDFDDCSDGEKWW